MSDLEQRIKAAFKKLAGMNHNSNNEVNNFAYKYFKLGYLQGRNYIGRLEAEKTAKAKE